MNCATCKVNKIGPNTAPYGGYMCGNEHLQCCDCNALAEGQCRVCEDSTNFVQMNYNNQSTTLTSPHPTAPQLDTESIFGPSDQTTSNILPKDFFANIETQSSISQERLSMQGSNGTPSEHGDTEAPSPALLPAPQQKQQQQPTPPMQCQHTQMISKTSALSQQTVDKLITDLRKNSPKPTAPHRLESTKTQSTDPMHTSLPKLSIQHKVSIESRLNTFSINDGKLEASTGVFECIDESNIMHTSEIRFMESSESLKNYYSGAAAHHSMKSKPEQAQNSSQQEVLSIRLLHDFESQNTAHPAELVENYLRSYGPLTLCNFPAYSINHSCPNGNGDSWTVQQRQMHMRSICVSTESDPSLAGICAPIKLELPVKYPPSEFFVMQATGVAEPAAGIIPDSDKIARTSIDIRMQKVLETFQEDPRQPNVNEKPLLDQTKNFVKIPVPEVQGPQGPQSNELSEVEPASASEIAEKTNIDIVTRLSNSHRAYYNPPCGRIASVRQGSITTQPAPIPQFQIITCSTMVTNELVIAKARYLNMTPIPACQLNIPRAPIQCPESSCHRMIFVSDFNKHLIVDHSKLPMERIAARQCKNFFLDPRLSHNGISKCHLFYLIRDKITDLGSGKYKDFLPLLIMSTRVKLSDLCGIEEEEERNRMTKSDVEFLMIWLTGIVPEEFPVSISLTVWPRSGQVPVCHMVHSGEMYSVRKSQRMADICASGQMLLLSAHEVQLLTNDGKEMLELQLVVH